jgi:hypothetical protein
MRLKFPVNANTGACKGITGLELQQNRAEFEVMGQNFGIKFIELLQIVSNEFNIWAKLLLWNKVLSWWDSAAALGHAFTHYCFCHW